jgi:hypothetical protein
VQELKRKIVRTHLQFLSELSCPALLYSDSERRYYSQSRELLKRENTLCEVTLPKIRREWTWLNSPLGEEDPRYTVELQIKAFYTGRTGANAS